MRGETILEPYQKKFIYEASQDYDFGTCIQDGFLKMLTKDLARTKAYSIIGVPEIVYDTKNYSPQVGNYRRIMNANNLDKIIYAYFDYPVPESALYLGTFDDDLAYQLILTVKDMTRDFRTTPFENDTLTMMVSMGLFSSLSEYDAKILDKQTLRYINDSISSSEQLFDVVMMDGLPKNMLDSIKK